MSLRGASIFSCFAALAVAAANGDGRIVNGEDAIPGQFPFMASVNYAVANHSCGGSILDSNSVLTAGHCCVTPFTDFSFSVVAGEHRLREEDGTEQQRDVREIVVHPEYDSVYVYNDLCILQLEEELELNEYVQPVPLPTTEDKDSPSESPGADVRVIGWGDTEFEGQFSDGLLYVDLHVVSDEYCLEAFGYWGPNPRTIDSMICAADFRDEQDACQGDSGGPLMCGGDFDDDGPDDPEGDGEGSFQCGIVSWGKECALRPYPGVYTQVSYFTQWIQTVMAEND